VLLETLEDVPPLGPEVAALPGDVEKATVAVVLGLEKPGRVVKGLPARAKEYRFDKRESPADSWAHKGSSAATLPLALPTRRTAGVADYPPMGA
jgi:hypothetical protein